LAAQLRRKYFGIRHFSSRDLAVQRDEHHPCWKAAHFLQCTRPPDVMRMHGPQRRTTFGLSERRAFVATRSEFQPMPSGGLGDDEDTVAGASFGNVRQPALLVKSADYWCCDTRVSQLLHVPPRPALPLDYPHSLPRKRSCILRCASLLTPLTLLVPKPFFSTDFGKRSRTLSGSSRTQDR
jgi:hypothetical protein